ncbi:MAG: 2,3-bisphosphoglycerate-independent phosphoglycerate mutase [Phototrophicales bacterium]|nr:MAG: 2,3-bisphosphoglycerate-independent phosphoglycerate mutase [Phototrophicales bacterium]RMG71986.1 MAG: 2,3-bisphosphoglycerate-independent phosphoglycerate mutase [Chloroflexota bacterium]
MAKPVMLIILDGWGIRDMEHGNAVKLANTPNYDHWLKNYEKSVIDTFGEHVGLTPGQMGNSEVGHLNLGAGRVVYQDITRIEMAIRDKTLGKHESILKAFTRAKQSNKKVHLIGLLGPGGVHSHQSHLHALMGICKEHGFDPVIHVITDGRDTPTQSGIEFLRDLKTQIDMLGVGRIASVSGRYYAMDRDKRWERTARAFNAMVYRQSDITASTAEQAIQQSYDKGVTDEFIEPTVIGNDDNLKIESGDVVICYNFRADRMRQLTQALVLQDFEGASCFTFVPDLHVLTMTQYIEGLPVDILFPPLYLNNTLAEVISKAGKTQYHSAETEKYPHVTFFFNGRREEPWEGEARQIIPSPKVATYDLKPEMSAYELTEATLKRMEEYDDDFILINFANPDMVGHTGVLEAAIKAVEAVDECAGRLVNKVLEKDGVAIVTADHGNCERMINEITGEPHTYHTVGPVNLFVIGNQYHGLITRGKLADVAPTVLELMGLPQPEEMTGMSLLEHTGA